MGFVKTSADKKTKGNDLTQSKSFLHKHQCNVCPLNNQTDVETPHMDPSGTDEPVVYFLGEAPGPSDDKQGQPFTGKAGKIVRDHIPSGWGEDIRFNNVVRTHPEKSRTPTFTEIECCRPSVNADIEKSKPDAIIGFGNIPLYWAMGKDTGVGLWSGKKFPIKIGEHTCWYFPINDPTAILKEKYPKDAELEHVLGLHLKWALEQIDHGLRKPDIYSEERARTSVEYVTGHGGSNDFKRIERFIGDCYDKRIVGFDYETKCLRPYHKDAKILSLGLSHNKLSLAFPLDHPGSGFSEKQTNNIWKLVEDFIYEAKCVKAVHNVAFELEWTGKMFGRDALRAGKWSCSQLKAYVMDERPGTLSLGFQTYQYFGFALKEISDLDKNNLNKEKIEQVLAYNALDAKFHRLVDIEQNYEISELDIWPLYDNLMERIITLVLTQMKGVPIDKEMVGKFYNQFSGMLSDTGSRINKLPEVRAFEKQTGKTFNPLSPQDFKRLFADMGIHLDKYDEEHLKDVDHPFAKLLLDYRGYGKTLSTYVLPLMSPEDLKTYGHDPEVSCVFPDEMIHPILSTTRVRTSRTSSNGPNSQNFNKHYDEADVGKDYQWKTRKQIKHKFKKIVAFDYAGMQARNVAMESRDKVLVDSFWTGYDIHHDWAMRLGELHPKWITDIKRYWRVCDALEAKKDVSKEDKDYAKWYRQLAKNNFVFATFFGAFPKTTAERLSVPVDVMEQMYDDFWIKFPDIKKYHNRQATTYEKYGYVDSLSGFKRHAPVSSTELINSGIQADEAMIVCSAMTRLSQMGEERFQPNMEIHDDLTFIWDKSEIEKNAEVVMKEMTRLAFPWMSIVPIEVEMSIGDNWSELEEVSKANSVQLWNHKRTK